MRPQYATLGSRRGQPTSRPGRWHCIDYAIVEQSSRRRCMDVSVMQGAECNTDHQRLRLKLVVKLFRKQSGNGMSRFDVAKLHGRSVDDKGRFDGQRCIPEAGV